MVRVLAPQAFKRVLEGFQFSVQILASSVGLYIEKCISEIDLNFYFKIHQESIECCRSDWTLYLRGLHVIFRWLRQSWGHFKKTNEIGRPFCSGSSSGIVLCCLSPASAPVSVTKGPLSLSAVPRLGNAALQTFTAGAGALLQLGLKANLSTFCFHFKVIAVTDLKRMLSSTKTYSNGKKEKKQQRNNQPKPLTKTLHQT